MWGLRAGADHEISRGEPLGIKRILDVVYAKNVKKFLKKKRRLLKNCSGLLPGPSPVGSLAVVSFYGTLLWASHVGDPGLSN